MAKMGFSGVASGSGDPTSIFRPSYRGQGYRTSTIVPKGPKTRTFLPAFRAFLTGSKVPLEVLSQNAKRTSHSWVFLTNPAAFPC